MQQLMNDVNLGEQGSILQKAKYAFIIFGILDLISFYLGLNFITYVYHVNLQVDFISLLNFVFLISFLVSGIFFLLRKKKALKIYFFQFLLKIVFLNMSFNFLFYFVRTTYGSSYYWFLLSLILIGEIIRLVVSISLIKNEKLKDFYKSIKLPNIN